MCDASLARPASVVAEELRNHVGLIAFVSDDPLALLDAVGQVGGDLDEAHRWLTGREVEVVETAVETPGLRQLLKRFDGPIAVASNNAAAAIERWLDLVGLDEYVSHVEGRDPRTMKPHPRSVVGAARALGVMPAQCCFIGDSLSDGVAAQAGAMWFIALAPAQAKKRLFAAADVRVSVTGLAELMMGWTYSLPAQGTTWIKTRGDPATKRIHYRGVNCG